eukprot:s1122_g4.t1
MYECCDCHIDGVENVETVVQEPTLISNEPMTDAWVIFGEVWIFEVSSLNLAVALGYAGAKQKFAQRDAHSTRSASVMSLRLEDQALLRGTSIVQVLRRLGSELRVNSLSKDFSPQEALELQLDELQRDGLWDSASPKGENMHRRCGWYGRSQEVKEIDYFISHCWQDGRFAKTVALLIHSNLWTAIFVSTVVAFVMSALTRVKLLPAVRPAPEDNAHFPWALCIGMLTFFLVLCTWHQPRALLCKLMRRSHAATYTYFLDKFCVHQGNLTLKQQGVRSFAAFVAASKNLLLLWSPQYFTRLWCTLELAALVKSKSHLGTLPLRIMPLQLAKVSLVSWVCAFLVFTLYQFNKVVGKPIPELAILAAALLVGGYGWGAALRQYARDRKAMGEQIGSFSVQSAKCSDPRDRTWVERTMLRWFADLESCNQHIRRGLEEQISDALGPETHFPTSLAMPIFLVNLGARANVFSELDYVAAGYYDLHTFRRTMGAIGQASGALALLPASYRLSLCFATRHSWPVEVLINCLLSFALTAMAFCIFFLNFWVVADESRSDWTVSVAVLQILFLMWLQRGSLHFQRRAVRKNRPLGGGSSGEALGQASVATLGMRPDC